MGTVMLQNSLKTTDSAHIMPVSVYSCLHNFANNSHSTNNTMSFIFILVTLLSYYFTLISYLVM